MRQIIKTSPPNEFIEYCITPGVSFGGLTGDAKKALRKRLLENQGYICCYCGCRINNDEHTKIEHIKCQKNYGALALDFNNLLASCNGGENDRSNNVIPKHQVHCDSKKGNNDLPISPLEDIESLLFYFEDGTIKGRGDKGKALIRILGLDTPFLTTQRRNAIESYEIKRPDDLMSELDRLKSKEGDCFEEFCFVLEQYVIDLINDIGNDCV